MKYNDFGKTGVKISALGFGCMRLPMVKVNGGEIVDEEKTIPLIHRAIELGVNYFDSAYMYCEGLSENALGKALKGKRDRVIVSTKSPGSVVKKPGDYRATLEEQLKKLDMDYIDFYHFHGIGYDGFFENDRNSNWHKEAIKAKEEGLIKHISFSFHDKPEAMIKLIDTGFFESVLCQYNVIDRSNEAAIAYAKEKGLGVAVMGPLGGGRVSGLPRQIADKLGLKIKASAELGIRFVLSNPNIDCALSGMSSLQMLEENAATASNPEVLSKEEIDGINGMMEENRKLSELYCTGCKYCMPCPSNVNIPYIFSLMNYYKIYGIKEFARDRYNIEKNAWLKGSRADECVECGICEEKCPQKIKIREQLKESHAALI